MYWIVLYSDLDAVSSLSHFLALCRKSSQPALMVSRTVQSADSASATNLETVSVVI